MNLKPLSNHVFIEPLEEEKTTKSGIVIPDTAKEKPQKGTVVAVGPGKYAEQTGNLIPMAYKVGDVVLYGKYAGTEITHEGKEYLIMRESDIFATL